MSDILGSDRFAAHREWRCSGHIDGDIDAADHRVFGVERRGDRWLLTADDDELVVVGDAVRDLLATDGGLARCPATQGFVTYFAARLLRRIGTFGEFGRWEVVGEPIVADHAGRPAHDVIVRHAEYELTLGVDDETGIWTWLHVGPFSIVVDELTVAPADVAAAFVLLDLVPELDLSPRVTASEKLTPMIEALRSASGFELEVMYEDVQTGEFRLIMVDQEGRPQALIRRSHAPTPQTPAVFGGLQNWWDSEKWSYHVDTVSKDPLWSGRIEKALNRLE